ncbi:MAG TPA: AraC family transcriptional regulator [Gemmatimonadaceae bacterium]|nr:AraC family transcriptional regulator [Gemmatimonadaceae bacterium]
MSERTPDEAAASPRDRAELAAVRMASGTAVELMRSSYRAQTFPKHTHEFFTIGLVLRGAGTLWYRGTIHLARHGDIVVIPPGEVHTGSVAPGAGVLEYVAAHVPREVVAGCDDQCDNVDLESPVVLDVLVASQLRRLERAVIGDRAALAASEEALTTAVGRLVDRHRRGVVSKPNDRAAEPRVVHIARELLEDCYGDNDQTSLRALSLRTGVSPFHLVRVFTRSVGLSPHQYLVQTRIRHATKLLANGLPCSFVAAVTGFADQSHLTTQFKRYLGITPASYQRCVRAD